MDKKLKTKWVKALRSGKYKQLVNTDYPTQYRKGNEFCCLGVLLHVTGVERMPNKSPTGNKLNALGVSDQSTLACMNDNGKSFKQIAAYIEKHL